MKYLKFLYSMQIRFEEPVREHRFTLKCIPLSDERQQINGLSIDVYPKEFLSMDEDSFGNSCIYGYEAGEHDHFSIIVTGDARTGLSDSIPAQDIYKIGIYKYQTDDTLPGEALSSFHDRIGISGYMSNLEKAKCYMDAVYENMSYVQGVTDVHTTAEQAFVLGQGVCQDYTHIMLSLCRMDNIPSRYVVGLLMGEGLSHAWIEIYEDGRWIALDPTNHLIVEDQHIKISNGRDFKDCTINQGLFTGRGAQKQQVRVKVTEWKDGIVLT